jgi:hypothetical protein
MKKIVLMLYCIIMVQPAFSGNSSDYSFPFKLESVRYLGMSLQKIMAEVPSLYQDNRYEKFTVCKQKMPIDNIYSDGPCRQGFNPNNSTMHETYCASFVFNRKNICIAIMYVPPLKYTTAGIILVPSFQLRDILSESLNKLPLLKLVQSKSIFGYGPMIHKKFYFSNNHYNIEIICVGSTRWGENNLAYPSYYVECYTISNYMK